MALFEFERTENTIAYNADWQYPAITEQHALIQARNVLPRVQDSIYFGFPWATYIDLKSRNNPRAKYLEEILESATEVLRPYRNVVTVCQHIRMLTIADQMHAAGVNNVFWSHAVKGQSAQSHLRIYPFPLYPVQRMGDSYRNNVESTTLFSFVGARANDWYLSQARNYILDHLCNDTRGHVLGRDQWHFQKVVYEHQIAGTVTGGELVDAINGREYSESLKSSIFALCPSGSGPNSIRLWEAIGFGAIPVIIADTYEPPGNPDLWAAAVVVCPERLDEIIALPDKLETWAQDAHWLRDKRVALKQLWLLYGPDWFVHDIHKLFLEFGSKSQFADAERVRFCSSRLRKMAAEANKPDASAACLRMFAGACSVRLLVDTSGFVAEYYSSESIRAAIDSLLSDDSFSCGHSETLKRTLQLKAIAL